MIERRQLFWKKLQAGRLAGSVFAGLDDVLGAVRESVGPQLEVLP